MQLCSPPCMKSLGVSHPTRRCAAPARHQCVHTLLHAPLTLDHVGHCLAGEVQQPLDVEVVGRLGSAGREWSQCSAVLAGQASTGIVSPKEQGNSREHSQDKRGLAYN